MPIFIFGLLELHRDTRCWEELVFCEGAQPDSNFFFSFYCLFIALFFVFCGIGFLDASPASVLFLFTSSSMVFTYFLFPFSSSSFFRYGLFFFMIQFVLFIFLPGLTVQRANWRNGQIALQRAVFCGNSAWWNIRSLILFFSPGFHFIVVFFFHPQAWVRKDWIGLDCIGWDCGWINCQSETRAIHWMEREAGEVRRMRRRRRQS